MMKMMMIIMMTIIFLVCINNKNNSHTLNTIYYHFHLTHEEIISFSFIHSVLFLYCRKTSSFLMNASTNICFMLQAHTNTHSGIGRSRRKGGSSSMKKTLSETLWKSQVATDEQSLHQLNSARTSGQTSNNEMAQDCLIEKPLCGNGAGESSCLQTSRNHLTISQDS